MRVAARNAFARGPAVFYSLFRQRSEGIIRLTRVNSVPCHTTADRQSVLCSPLPRFTSDTRSALEQLEAGIGPLKDTPHTPPPAAVVVVISGPSGVGKDAVIKKLQEVRPDLYFVVTATSRPIRPGEVEGKDYFFVTKERFEEWIDRGALLEHALVYGDYKGIPREQVDNALRLGTDVILRIDIQGAATVRKLMPGAVSIFIAAETEAQLVERLVSRKTEPLDKMMVRVQTARKEMEHIREFDYVVVNREGCLDDCVAQISGIIDAEKLRTTRRY